MATIMQRWQIQLECIITFTIKSCTNTPKMSQTYGLEAIQLPRRHHIENVLWWIFIPIIAHWIHCKYHCSMIYWMKIQSSRPNIHQCTESSTFPQIRVWAYWISLTQFWICCCAVFGCWEYSLWSFTVSYDAISEARAWSWELRYVGYQMTTVGKRPNI